MDFTFASDVHADAEHAVVVDLGVVADVYLIHKEVAVADFRSVGAAVAFWLGSVPIRLLMSVTFFIVRLLLNLQPVQR